MQLLSLQLCALLCVSHAALLGDFRNFCKVRMTTYNPQDKCEGDVATTMWAGYMPGYCYGNEEPLNGDLKFSVRLSADCDSFEFFSGSLTCGTGVPTKYADYCMEVSPNATKSRKIHIYSEKHPTQTFSPLLTETCQVTEKYWPGKSCLATPPQAVQSYAVTRNVCGANAFDKDGNTISWLKADNDCSTWSLYSDAECTKPKFKRTQGCNLISGNGTSNSSEVNMRKADYRSSICQIKVENYPAGKNCGTTPDSIHNGDYVPEFCYMVESGSGTMVSAQLSGDCTMFTTWPNANCDGKPTENKKADGQSCYSYGVLGNVKMTSLEPTKINFPKSTVPMDKMCQCSMSVYKNKDCTDLIWKNRQLQFAEQCARDIWHSPSMPGDYWYKFTDKCQKRQFYVDDGTRSCNLAATTSNATWSSDQGCKPTDDGTAYWTMECAEPGNHPSPPPAPLTPTPNQENGAVKTTVATLLGVALVALSLI